MKLANLFKGKRVIDEKPVVSVIGTAIRTNLWREFYKSIEANLTPFEVVFVGNKIPGFKLPYNFRFICSNVKPVQCLEIAVRNARGEYLLVVADDCRLSKYAIDILYKQFKKLNSEKNILSGRWVKNGKEISIAKHRYKIGDANSPILAVGAFLRKEFWFRLGGLDCRFIASCADIDLTMRAYEHGGTVVLNKRILYEERKDKRGGINLYLEYGARLDRPLLDSFWMKNGRISKKRLNPLKPFKEKQLLTVTQGNKGRWI